MLQVSKLNPWYRNVAMGLSWFLTLCRPGDTMAPSLCKTSPKAVVYLVSWCHLGCSIHPNDDHPLEICWSHGMLNHVFPLDRLWQQL